MGQFDSIENDKRILEQKLRRHQLSQQEYQKMLKVLSDDSANAEEIQVIEPEAHSE